MRAQLVPLGLSGGSPLAVAAQRAITSWQEKIQQ